MARIGTIEDIRRYPVKSFAGERLAACDIEPYGLSGDRFYAFHDGQGAGWNSYITARDVPAMLGYGAQLDEDGGVRVTAPDGRRFGWDSALAEELQAQTRRRVHLTSGPAPEEPERMAVDQGSILLIADTDLRRLEAAWGKPVDPRRFRANLLVRLDAGAGGAQDWLGRRLTVGRVRLRVDESCERCTVITLDPDTRERDASLLRAVNDTMALTFGVYASVVMPGPVRLGDEVLLEETPAVN
ncbi:MAG: MOSC domain-containing protein [Paenibacillaceae bacterium]|nr:MOSC domain-containing protein [Paenibacillaceae bacterium]